ncbi:MAG TPA: glycoside hydrolase family 44 protein [Polyangiaceae bacterium]
MHFPVPTLARLTAWLLAGWIGTACVRKDGPPSAPADGPQATDSEAPLPAGIEVLGSRGIAAFEVHGEVAKVSLETVSVEGQPFDEALQAAITEESGSEWSVQVQAKNAEPVAKGDVLLATFFARVVKELESGGGETQFVFEKASEPYTKSITYPIRLTPEWRKIHVRFVAGEDYAPGQAQAIFRLGYEPETLQIGGVSVENFKDQVAIARLPTSEAEDKRLAEAPEQAEVLPVIDGGELRLAVNAAKVIGGISPYVYGINSQKIGDTGATVRRNGGNRGSVYNWELNASNAGKDYHHQNDKWPCQVMGYKTCDEPGAQFVEFIEENQAAGAESVVEIPMQDYVSADDKGPVRENESAPSSRFLKNYPKKNGELVLPPKTNDGAVYQDEFVKLLVTRFGKASDGGPKFYSLDNEPALWNTTHPRVHPNPVTYEELVQRSEATAAAILDVDPSAFILGGVYFAWSEIQNLASAGEYQKYNAVYERQVDYFLDMMKKLEKRHGKRLVHGLDFHWYPEARGRKRITEEASDKKTVDARLQAPRSFWDPTYQEKSWIADQIAGPIRLLPFLKEVIAKRYPGTQLTMTEYNFGGTSHISGGLAQIDVLGVLGREGVYLANYWGSGAGVGDLPPYIAQAFKLYRNYDGKGGKFGDIAVAATTPDLAAVSIFAAKNSKNPGELGVIVVNKDQQKRFAGVIAVGGYKSARAFVLDSSGPVLKSGPPATVAGGVIKYTLPPLSATLFVCTTT